MAMGDANGYFYTTQVGVMDNTKGICITSIYWPIFGFFLSH